LSFHYFKTCYQHRLAESLSFLLPRVICMFYLLFPAESFSSKFSFCFLTYFGYSEVRKQQRYRKSTLIFARIIYTFWSSLPSLNLPSHFNLCRLMSPNVLTSTFKTCIFFYLFCLQNPWDSDDVFPSALHHFDRFTRKLLCKQHSNFVTVYWVELWKIVFVCSLLYFCAGVYICMYISLFVCMDF
jgi:hypothetical protein